MLKKVFNWLIDKWLAGFITASFFFFLKLYIDLPEERKTNFFNFDWLGYILKTDMAIWKVIIIIGFLILMFWVRNWWKIGKEYPLSKDFNRLNHSSSIYRVDTFGVDNAKWTWDYDWDPSKENIIIKDVLPLCPVCNSKMEFDSHDSSDYAICTKCRIEGKNYHFHLNQFFGDVAKETVRRLNSGEWKSRISQ